MGITLNPIVDVGTIFQLVGFIIAVTAIVYIQRGDIKLLAHRMTAVEDQTRQIANVVTNMATEKTRLDNQGDRMNRIEKKVEELAHGEGFVIPLFKPPAG